MKHTLVIVGAGLAGLSAALTAVKNGWTVKLVSSLASERAQSVMAEGGINAALNTKGEEDSPEQHYTDTLTAACGLADPNAVWGMTQAASELVRSLHHLGVQFNVTDDDELDLRNFGGQKKKRTAFAQSDTGKQLMTALIDAVRREESAGTVERFPHHKFRTLLLSGNICGGCTVQDTYTGELLRFVCDAVLIATGGLHGLFGDTTGSLANTGEVTAELFRLGVPMANLEMIQYHPTTVELGEKRMLLSEAARGEGGRLLVPDAHVVYAHGQMSERELEAVMFAFINGDIDVLVSTTIIETGLDISNVNTMIIHDSDRYGLSQLYQLRGRIGRSNRTAYAFLMYRRNTMLKETAEKRLSAIREYTDLGSGFKIAMRDLELRGAGNLLGAEQHGHMNAVGYDLYCKMLSEAVKEAKGIHTMEDFETTIDLNMDAFIPDSYISNEYQKLDIYKRIAGIETQQDYDDMLEELLDRFGEMPKAVMNLLSIARLKALAHRCYVTEIKQIGRDMKITLYENAKLNPVGFPALMQKYRRGLQFKNEQEPKILFTPEGSGNVLTALTDLLTELEQLVEE